MDSTSRLSAGPSPNAANRRSSSRNNTNNTHDNDDLEKMEGSASHNFTSDFDNVSPCMHTDEPRVHSAADGASGSPAAGPMTGGAPQHSRQPSVSQQQMLQRTAAEAAAVWTLHSDGPIGVDHVNWLLQACGISQERTIVSLRQCSSSLFALLFQRIFNCTIPDLELEPNTQEKRLWNIQRVLEELQLFVSNDLSYISAQRIVSLDEEHISELIRVFFEIVMSFVMQPASGTGAGGANGMLNQSGLSGNQLPEDDVSQADSAHKTQRLVTNWKKELVHPLRDVSGGKVQQKPTTSGGGRRGVGFNAASLNSAAAGSRVGKRTASASQGQPRISDSVVELHSRMYNLDQVLVPPRGIVGAGKNSAGQRKRPTSSPSRAKVNNTGTSGEVASYRDLYFNEGSRLFPPSTYSLVKTLNTEARDIRIEELKTARFITEIQQTMRRDIINKSSKEQAAIAGTIKGQQRLVRSDTRDMLQYARDENAKYRSAYECVLMSARNEVARCRDLIDPVTLHIYERNRKATRAASATVKASVAQQRATEDTRVERYYKSVTSWRKGTIACM